MTLRQFAERRCGVSHTHLNFILRGKRHSPRIDLILAGILTWAFGPETAQRFYPPETS